MSGDREPAECLAVSSTCGDLLDDGDAYGRARTHRQQHSGHLVVEPVPRPAGGGGAPGRRRSAARVVAPAAPRWTAAAGTASSICWVRPCRERVSCATTGRRARASSAIATASLGDRRTPSRGAGRETLSSARGRAPRPSAGGAARPAWPGCAGCAPPPRRRRPERARIGRRRPTTGGDRSCSRRSPARRRSRQRPAVRSMRSTRPDSARVCVRVPTVRSQPTGSSSGSSEAT